MSIIYNKDGSIVVHKTSAIGPTTFFNSPGGNECTSIAPDRRYMITKAKLKPLERDPFWTQQGKRKKGKQGRY